MRKILWIFILITLIGCKNITVTKNTKGRVVNDESQKYKITAYLPKSYEYSDKNYPVIYVSNIMNVMEKNGWDIPTVMEEMIDKNEIKESIVIAFEPKNSYYDEKEIATELVSYIDSKYKTLKNKGNRIICGGSYGGGLAIKTAILFPEIFSAAGGFSFHPFIGNAEFIRSKEKQNISIWISEGTKENGSDYYLKFGRNARDILLQKGYKYGEDLFCHEEIGGTHGGGSWINSFRLFAKQFNGNGKNIVKDIEPRPVFLDGPSRTAYINTAILLENGSGYSAKDIEYNIEEGSDTEIDKEGFVYFGRQKKAKVEIVYKNIRKNIELDYDEIFKENTIPKMRIYSTLIPNKTVNLENVDLRFFKGINYVNKKDFVRIVTIFKNIEEKEIELKYGAYIVKELEKEYIPVVFINNELDFQQIIYKTNILFMADKKILLKILKEEYFGDAIGIKTDIFSADVRKFTYEYLLSTLAKNKNIEQEKINEIKKRFDLKIIESKSWFEYYDLINNILDEISPDSYILKYGNTYFTEDILYNLFKFENNEVVFLIDKAKTTKIGKKNPETEEKESIKKEIRKMVPILEEDQEQSAILIETEKTKIFGSMSEVLGKFKGEELFMILPDNSIFII